MPIKCSLTIQHPYRILFLHPISRQWNWIPRWIHHWLICQNWRMMVEICTIETAGNKQENADKLKHTLVEREVISKILYMNSNQYYVQYKTNVANSNSYKTHSLVETACAIRYHSFEFELQSILYECSDHNSILCWIPLWKEWNENENNAMMDRLINCSTNPMVTVIGNLLKKRCWMLQLSICSISNSLLQQSQSQTNL